ncbi:6344_t:CDS:2 [Funneliformis geosporum]|nr:6344_t:CDS:2 [Funneliformis geosporum]
MMNYYKEDKEDIYKLRKGALKLINGNSIADLDLNDCTELRELKCLSNQLTKLDLNNCPTLDCGNNQLTSLDISKLINLRALECPDNLLTSLDLSNCRKLLYLNCSENKLANLDVSSLVKLEHLCCSYNKLKHLKFGESSSLKELKCSGNLLNSTKFTSTLEKLYVSENDFPKQDLFIFSKFINLRILNLENNHFHGSLKFLEKLDELQELYIDNTDIDEGVEFLPDSLEYFSFSGCSKIEEADKKNGGKYSRKNERKQAVKNATSLILNHVFSEESKSKPEAIPSEELEKIINEKTNIKGKIIDKHEVYSGYAVRLVIYEPPLEKIKEKKAQKKTELIKEKLNSDNPILAVAKKSSSLDNVIQKSTLPYNIDPKEHLRPLDIV